MEQMEKRWKNGTGDSSLLADSGNDGGFDVAFMTNGAEVATEWKNAVLKFVSGASSWVCCGSYNERNFNPSSNLQPCR